MPSWDNKARQQDGAAIFLSSSLDLEPEDIEDLSAHIITRDGTVEENQGG